MQSRMVNCLKHGHIASDIGVQRKQKAFSMLPKMQVERFAFLPVSGLTDATTGKETDTDQN